MTFIKVKPRPGLIVRDPVTLLPIPEEGIVVEKYHAYWCRRIRDRDVTEHPADDATEQPEQPRRRGRQDQQDEGGQG